MTWSILHGDALEVMASMDTNSVDAVVCDPPYGERAAAWDSPRSREWHISWVAAAGRILKPNAPLIAFFSRRYLDILMGVIREVRGDTSECPLQTGAWVHRQGFSPSAGFLRPEHEPFIVSGRLRVDAEDVRLSRPYGTDWSVKDPVRRNVSKPNADKWGFRPTTYTPDERGPIGGTVFEAARNIGAERVDHPTQKPEAVMAYLVALACPPRGLVLDPFGGSFTTAVVALRSGRSFIGCDASAEYCELGRRRLVADAPLFNQPQETA